MARKLEYEKRIKHLKELQGKTADPAKKKHYKKQIEELELALNKRKNS
jgi:hypothetical protein